MYMLCPQDYDDLVDILTDLLKQNIERGEKKRAEMKVYECTLKMIF